MRKSLRCHSPMNLQHIRETNIHRTAQRSVAQLCVILLACLQIYSTSARPTSIGLHSDQSHSLMCLCLPVIFQHMRAVLIVGTVQRLVAAASSFLGSPPTRPSKLNSVVRVAICKKSFQFDAGCVCESSFLGSPPKGLQN